MKWKWGKKKTKQDRLVPLRMAHPIGRTLEKRPGLCWAWACNPSSPWYKTTSRSWCEAQLPPVERCVRVLQTIFCLFVNEAVAFRHRHYTTLAWLNPLWRLLSLSIEEKRKKKKGDFLSLPPSFPFASRTDYWLARNYKQQHRSDRSTLDPSCYVSIATLSYLVCE